MRKQLEHHEGVDEIEKTFWKEAKVGINKHWILLIHLVLMMAGFKYITFPMVPKTYTQQCWKPT
ncbi:hypothetical protein HOY80DRAFT_1078113 [Tuber brumale]|nr:hypothetical protein HOY80DRAFT_1078113 [Tuber brumale]